MKALMTCLVTNWYTQFRVLCKIYYDSDKKNQLINSYIHYDQELKKLWKNLT